MLTWWYEDVLLDGFWSRIETQKAALLPSWKYSTPTRNHGLGNKNTSLGAWKGAVYGWTLYIYKRERGFMKHFAWPSSSTCSNAPTTLGYSGAPSVVTWGRQLAPPVSSTTSASSRPLYAVVALYHWQWFLGRRSTHWHAVAITMEIAFHAHETCQAADAVCFSPFSSSPLEHRACWLSSMPRLCWDEASSSTTTCKNEPDTTVVGDCRDRHLWVWVWGPQARVHPFLLWFMEKWGPWFLSCYKYL